jgi:hypothetical protein
VTVPRASQRLRESWDAMHQPRCTTASESQHIKTQKGYAGKGCWPHPRVRILSRGGSGSHCRYPKDRVPPRTSFKSRQRLHASQLRVALRLSRVPAAQAPAPISGQLRGRHVSSWLRLPFPARGSSGDATCPRGLGSPSWPGAAPGPPRVPGLCGLQASKQISSGDPVIMISIGAGAPVSSKALRDKGCFARSQGMQQAAH